MSEKMEIQISLSIDEANILLEALGKQPFNQVFQIIGKIQQQASIQLNGHAGEVNGVPDKTERV